MLPVRASSALSVDAAVAVFEAEADADAPFEWLEPNAEPTSGPAADRGGGGVVRAS